MRRRAGHVKEVPRSGAEQRASASSRDQLRSWLLGPANETEIRNGVVRWFMCATPFVCALPQSASVFPAMAWRRDEARRGGDGAGILLRGVFTFLTRR